MRIWLAVIVFFLSFVYGLFYHLTFFTHYVRAAYGTDVEPWWVVPTDITIVAIVIISSFFLLFAVGGEQLDRAMTDEDKQNEINPVKNDGLKIFGAVMLFAALVFGTYRLHLYSENLITIKYKAAATARQQEWDTQIWLDCLRIYTHSSDQFDKCRQFTPKQFVPKVQSKVTYVKHR